MVCYPFWQIYCVGEGDAWLNVKSERWAKLLLGPEQIACYCCFVWSLLIFGGRYWEMRRQRTAFGMNMLPTEEGRGFFMKTPGRSRGKSIRPSPSAGRSSWRI